MSELLLKLARLAFDPAAHSGEAEAAAVKLVGCARRDGLNFEGFVQALGGVPPPAAEDASHRRPRSSARSEGTDPGDFRMPFGKHEGEKLRDIDRSYLKWCEQKFQEGRVKEMIRKYLKQQK